MYLISGASFQKFAAFIQSPVVLSTATSFVFSQFIKYAIAIKKRSKRRDSLEALLWRTGGMPSTHAAIVTALCTTIGTLEGINSPLFVVTLFFLLVVLRDAMGVRRSAGIQAKNLNMLGRKVEEKLGIEYHPVKEVQGHNPIEVLVGSFIGIIISLAYAYL